jgi:hypothetical protein
VVAVAEVGGIIAAAAVVAAAATAGKTQLIAN